MEAQRGGSRFLGQNSSQGSSDSHALRRDIPVGQFGKPFFRVYVRALGGHCWEFGAQTRDGSLSVQGRMVCGVRSPKALVGSQEITIGQ